MQSKKLTCKIIYGNTTDSHLSQILSGYELLKNMGLIKFKTEYNPKYINNQYIHNVLIEVNFSNGTRICYDLSDGYHGFVDMGKFDNILEKVDFYFKRSSNDKINSVLKNKQKIKTLGFNYFVSCKKNPFYDFKYFKESKLSYLKQYYHYFRTVNKINSDYNYKNFESKPNSDTSDYKVLYNVRLWDHEQIKLENLINGFPELSLNEVKCVHEKWQFDYKNITEERIEQIKALKDNLKEKFVGGIIENKHSLKIAPNLLASNNIVNKKEYIKLIKGNFICIANRGLHNSTGWKFAEYIAASKAIISEPLTYNVVGDFKEENNYLTFTSPEILVDKASYLLNNIDLIHRMEKENYMYYQKFLKPDKLIYNTLVQIGLLKENNNEK